MGGYSPKGEKKSEKEYIVKQLEKKKHRVKKEVLICNRAPDFGIIN